MTSSIEAIFFDVGGTLRATIKGEGNPQGYLRRLQEFIGDNRDVESFLSEMRKREKTYRHWCKKTLRELPETELWSRFMLPAGPKCGASSRAKSSMRPEIASGSGSRADDGAEAGVDEATVRGVLMARLGRNESAGSPAARMVVCLRKVRRWYGPLLA